VLYVPIVALGIYCWKIQRWINLNGNKKTPLTIVNRGYKKCQSKSCKTWHSLTLEVFLNICIRYEIFKTHLKNFVWPLYSTCSCLFFFVLATNDFCNWGCHGQVVLWRIPRHLRLLTIEALGANGKNHGVGEEGSLLGLLQTLTNMWSFF